MNGRLRLSGAAYVTRITRLISQYADLDTNWDANGAEVRAVGAEFEAERRWTSGIVAHGSFPAQRTHEVASARRLSNSPGMLGTFRLETPLVTRLATVAVDWQYVSERLTDSEASADDYALTHLTWRYTPRQLHGGWIAASVYNLFDVGATFRF